MFFGALQRGPVAVAVLTHYLAPIIVALSAAPLLKETPSRRALPAAGVSLLGLVLVLGWPGEGFPWMTAVLGGGSAVFYAASVLTGRVAGRSYTPLQVTALHAPISVGVLLVLFGASALPAALEPRLGWAVAGAVVCGLGAATLFYSGLVRVGAQGASALTYLEPLTASVAGALAFGEGLKPAAAVGIAVVLGAGVWVATEPAPQASAVTAAR
jgi:drug/metabolite transporter (DMT)-like permease